MRASIACVFCRKAKTRCDNTGPDSVCRTCRKADRQCVYPEPHEASILGKHKASSKANCAAARQRAAKRRQRRESSSTSETDAFPRSNAALDSHLLTPKVWIELTDIFQLHFSTELSFIHKTTFLKPVRKKSGNRARPAGSDGFLLAFLTLTSRFHPEIVALHSGGRSKNQLDPLAAANFYALAAQKHQVSVYDAENMTLDNLQTLLMLSLHWFDVGNGTIAWQLSGQAIRLALAMRLHLDTECLPRPCPVTSSDGDTLQSADSDSEDDVSEGSTNLDEDAVILQEIRRRTFWSCFIMDSLQSFEKARPSMLGNDEPVVPLPISEMAFELGQKKLTERIGSSHHSPMDSEHRDQHGSRGEDLKLEVGADEGLLAKYMRMQCILGQVARWSAAGGRRNEIHPPWDCRSTFDKLLKKCQAFKRSLPKEYHLTQAKTEAYLSTAAPRPYIHIHILYLVCQILLHRDYIPFHASACKSPQGPLDPPLLPRDEEPAGYWEHNSEELEKSTRSLIELADTCHEWRMLPQTPIISFAVYIASMTAMYCRHYPHMDHKHLLSKDTAGIEAGRRAENIVKGLANHLHRAQGFQLYFDQMNQLWGAECSTSGKRASSNNISAYYFNGFRLESPGGLDLYKVVEPAFHMRCFDNKAEQLEQLCKATERMKIVAQEIMSSQACGEEPPERDDEPTTSVTTSATALTMADGIQQRMDGPAAECDSGQLSSFQMSAAALTYSLHQEGFAMHKDYPAAVQQDQSHLSSNAYATANGMQDPRISSQTAIYEADPYQMMGTSALQQVAPTASMYVPTSTGQWQGAVSYTMPLHFEMNWSSDVRNFMSASDGLLDGRSARYVTDDNGRRTWYCVPNDNQQHMVYP